MRVSEIAAAHGSSSPPPFCHRISGDLRRARSVEEVLPWLWLKGISTGAMQEALEALLGPEAKGLSEADDLSPQIPLGGRTPGVE